MTTLVKTRTHENIRDELHDVSRMMDIRAREIVDQNLPITDEKFAALNRRSIELYEELTGRPIAAIRQSGVVH